MTPSNDCYDLTMASEGCRLKAYQDTGGVWTIGYGHTRDVHPGQTITQEQANEFLKKDMFNAVDAVNIHALPCTQGQFDALVDFVFNVGTGQFLSSTLYKLHKAAKYKEAALQFSRWIYDNGKVLPGLVTRRKAEAALYSH